MPLQSQILVNTLDGEYGFFNPKTGVFQNAGTFGTELTDISYAIGGNLYGIDFLGPGGSGELYLLNSDTGGHTLIGALPATDANGFLMKDQDTGIITTLSGQWIEFNIITGDIEYQTDLKDSLSSAGDVTLVRNSHGSFDWLVSTVDSSGDTYLLNYTYDADGNMQRSLDLLPLSDVFGLASAGAKKGIAYAFAGTKAYLIDTKVKTYNPLADFSLSGFGAVSGASDVEEAAYYQDLTNHLVWGYWHDSNREARAFVQNTISVDLSALDDAQEALVKSALNAWSDVADIDFQIVSNSNANIEFTVNSGEVFGNRSGTNDGAITYSTININPTGISSWEYGDFAYYTILHELGHALGLGHAGNYNGGDFRSGGDQDVLFSYDGFDVSIMSYVAPSRNPETDADWGVEDGAFSITPMLADIEAIRILYGEADPVRTGNTTYGFHTNLTGGRWQIDRFGGEFGMTIVDGGGKDKIDVSGYTNNQVIWLDDGTFSSIGGHKNNLSIAPGTIIENVVTGGGNDRLYGKGEKNILRAGDGNDRLSGGGGKDQLFGQNGKDVLKGGEGKDVLKGGAGVDRFVFKTDWGADIVKDFDAKGGVHDVLDLSGLRSVRNWSDLKSNHLERDGTDVVMDGKHGDVVILQGVSINDLDKGDFLF